MLGASQSWHWPVIEYVVPTHASHPVRSLFGPAPAGQAEHNVRSAFTTLGGAHSVAGALYRARYGGAQIQGKNKYVGSCFSRDYDGGEFNDRRFIKMSVYNSSGARSGVVTSRLRSQTLTKLTSSRTRLLQGGGV